MTLDQRDGNITHPSTAEGTRSWVATQLLPNDEAKIETGSLLDVVDDHEADPDLVVDDELINTNASVDLCIELGSGDMIDIDEDANMFLTIDIDSFLLINSYADGALWWHAPTRGVGPYMAWRLPLEHFGWLGSFDASLAVTLGITTPQTARSTPLGGPTPRDNTRAIV
jgi:hypothetical protein